MSSLFTCLGNATTLSRSSHCANTSKFSWCIRSTQRCTGAFTFHLLLQLWEPLNTFSRSDCDKIHISTDALRSLNFDGWDYFWFLTCQEKKTRVLSQEGHPTWILCQNEHANQFAVTTPKESSWEVLLLHETLYNIHRQHFLPSNVQSIININYYRNWLYIFTGHHLSF